MAIVVELISLAIIIWHSFCALDKMSKDTNKLLVLSIAVVFAASMARFWEVAMQHSEATASSAAIFLAFAVGMLVERRHSSCPCLPNYSPERHSKKNDHGGLIA